MVDTHFVGVVVTLGEYGMFWDMDNGDVVVIMVVTTRKGYGGNIWTKVGMILPN